MATSLARLSVRASNFNLCRHVLSRGLRTSPARNAASAFNMPAMSPTMTEGGIAVWHVKEGQEFSGGDVLLEVETDKAQIDVEAPEDGVMAKILVDAGSKGIKVGTRIAVIAEPGDDLATLEIPAEEGSKSESKSKPASSSSDTSSPKASESPKAAEESASPEAAADAAHSKDGASFPPSPSVAHLLHQHNLDASKIRGSGPKGRILKGDVLAHLQAIPASSPSELQKRITKLGKLDLSNIKIRPAAPPAPAAEKKKPTGPPPPRELAATISFAEVRRVQDRMQKTMGTFPPVTVFIDKALAQANHAVPAPPGVDELFNDVVGVANTPVPARFAPKIEPVFPSSTTATKEADIIDILSGAVSAREKAGQRVPQGGIMGNGENVFRLTVEAKEAERGEKFLNTVKGLLEKQPGQLVL